MEHLTAADFREKVFDYQNESEWNYKGDKPAIIDFYADWCGPCKMIAPIFEKLDQEYNGDVVFYKVDTEAEAELSQAFGIASIPSLLFIPAKDKPQMAQGALPEEAMKQAIKDVLGVDHP